MFTARRVYKRVKELEEEIRKVLAEIESDYVLQLYRSILKRLSAVKEGKVKPIK